jgi:iron complex outermembrane receptor protein
MPSSERKSLILAAVAAVLAAQLAVAEPVSFAIDAQDASTALTEFARQANRQLLFQFEHVKGVRTQAISGQYEPAEAIRLLLAGTGLVVSTREGGVLVVDADTNESARAVDLTSRSGVAPRTESGSLLRLARSAESPSTALTAAVADEAPDGEVVVTGLRQKTVATKLNVELRDLPQAVTIIPREVIDELAIIRVEDVGYATVGVQPVSPYTGGVSLGFFVRGFRGAAILVNGYDAGVVSGSSSTVLDFSTIERVEVLRGPASVLYGQGNPGGIVNVTTKRPQERFGAGADLLFGAGGGDGSRRATVDVTGPLMSEKLLFRFNAALEDSDSFRAFAGDERRLAAPSLEWQPREDVTVNVDYVRDRFTYTVDRFAGTSQELIQNLPLRRNLAEPWLGATEMDIETLRAQAEWRFAPDWALRASHFSYRHELMDGSPEIGILGPDVPGGTLIGRYFIDYPDADLNRRRDATRSVQLAGSLVTGPLQHELLVSYDEVDAFFNYNATIGAIGPIDYLNPVYSDGPLAPATAPYYEGASASDYRALYGQNLISVGEHWKLLVGLRRDSIVTTSYFDAARTVVGRTQRDRETTPRVGLIWRPVAPTTLYLSWGKSFLPNAGRGDRFGNQFPPEEGEALEGGIKQELLAGRAALTAAAFQIEKTNVLTIDPQDPAFAVNAGEARSRGFEVEMDGRLAPNWRVRAGMAYVDAQVTRSLNVLNGRDGDGLAGVSPWTANFNTRYDFAGGALDRWSVGGNASYADSRPSRLPNPDWSLEPHLKLDAFVAYRFGRAQAQLNLENLLDERILLSNGLGLVSFDNPRRVMLSLRYRFGGLEE